MEYCDYILYVIREVTAFQKMTKVIILQVIHTSATLWCIHTTRERASGHGLGGWGEKNCFGQKMDSDIEGI